MKYNDRAPLDPSQMGGGNRRPSGTVALGGGAGAIVVIVIALLFGVNPGQVLQGSGTTDPGTGVGHESPTISPSSSMSIDMAAALALSPGIVRMSPQIG